MNLVSLLLGHFNSSEKPFYLYRIENTSILLFNLPDVCNFFNLPSPLELLEENQTIQVFYRDKQQENEIYLSTNILGTLAIKYKKFLLAELCKLKPNDYAANLAEAILNNIPHLDRNTAKKDDSQYKQTDIELIEESNGGIVKLEPISPPPQLNKTQSSNSTDRMSIDTMLTHTSGAGSPPPKNNNTRRLSRTNFLLEDQATNNNKKHKKNESISILPKPIHTVSSQKAPPTLLSKRLGGHQQQLQQQSGKNMRNLTIYTPAYGEQLSNGIKSAPLNSNFRHQINNNNSKIQQPHPLSKTTLLSPATSTATSTEFAIPPIVPSQQQPPHTAHPSSKNFPPHSPQYPSSAYGHSFPVTSGRVIIDQPKTPTKSSTPSSSSILQRQQFMQPFEHLFDTIETTRNLKSTLDDQIRRSSTLLQTLQASSTTIEGLVRNQIKEVQKDILQRMEESIDNLFKRIHILEKKANIDSTEMDVELTNIKKPTTTNSISSSIINPPAIVKSQNDIGPNEYHVMLETLKERLDKLERQLEDS